MLRRYFNYKNNSSSSLSNYIDDDDEFINSIYSPYRWSKEDCLFNRNEVLNPLPDSYESMTDYKNVNQKLLLI